MPYHVSAPRREMDDYVYHHKRTLQYVRLGKVLLDSRVRPRAKRRAVISFANGAAAETSNCKCKITLRLGMCGGQRRTNPNWRRGAELLQSDGEERCPVLPGCPRLTLSLAAALVTQ